jgi:hypothetical protein
MQSSLVAGVASFSLFDHMLQAAAWLSMLVSNASYDPPAQVKEEIINFDARKVTPDLRTKVTYEGPAPRLTPAAAPAG